MSSVKMDCQKKERRRRRRRRRRERNRPIQNLSRLTTKVRKKKEEEKENLSRYRTLVRLKTTKVRELDIVVVKDHETLVVFEYLNLSYQKVTCYVTL